jgi:transcriptional regulator with XRE-family HTH domain
MKINKEQARAIKSDIAAGVLTQKKIAKKYNISRSTVSDIACGRIHKDVKVDDEVSDEEARILRLEAEVSHLRDEKNDLKRKLQKATKTQGLFDCIVDEMDRRVVPMPALPKARPEFTRDNDISVEHLVMHLSDGHHDSVITPDDSGGLERHDFMVSMCRGEHYVDTALKFTQKKLAVGFKFPSLTVLAYGDHTSGEIHGAVHRSHYRNMFKNCHAIGQLHALMYRDLAPYFEQVNVVYVPGNHGRRTQKKDYHGAHDNWDYLIATTARQYCREIDNVNFGIPNSFSTVVEIDGIGFHIFHGDDVRSVLGIPWYGLEKRKYRLMALNGLRDGVPIRYFCCGHFHRPGTGGEFKGEQILNGAWVATDAFAFNAIAGYTEPTQLLHGVTNKRGITWRLPVQMRCDYENEGPRRYRLEDMDEVSI